MTESPGLGVEPLGQQWFPGCLGMIRSKIPSSLDTLGPAEWHKTSYFENLWTTAKYLNHFPGSLKHLSIINMI